MLDCEHLNCCFVGTKSEQCRSIRCSSCAIHAVQGCVGADDTRRGRQAQEDLQDNTNIRTDLAHTVGKRLANRLAGTFVRQNKLPKRLCRLTRLTYGHPSLPLPGRKKYIFID